MNEPTTYSELIRCIRGCTDLILKQQELLLNIVPFKWNPVEEGLPKQGGFYFTAFANGDVRENEFITFENEEPKWYFNETERGGVTHWMYLPSPPQRKEQND